MFTRARLFVCLALALPCAAAGPARAGGNDFLDAAKVAGPIERDPRFGVGAETRVDRDYRIQGWLTAEGEAGLTSFWMIESSFGAVARGQGLETGTFDVETRLLLARQSSFPLSLALAGGYEVESRAAKRLALERVVEVRAVGTRVIAGSLLVTANAGIAATIAPIHRHAATTAFGVRYPEAGALVAGLEVARDGLDDETRAGPCLWLTFPHRIRLRLGGTAGIHARPYRFIARAVLEVE